MLDIYSVFIERNGLLYYLYLNKTRDTAFSLMSKEARFALQRFALHFFLYSTIKCYLHHLNNQHEITTKIDIP